MNIMNILYITFLENKKNNIKKYLSCNKIEIINKIY